MLVLSSYHVSVGEMPDSVSVGFIVTKIALVVSSISKDPPSFHDLIFSPFSDQLGPSLVVSISALSMLFAKHPPS